MGGDERTAVWHDAARRAKARAWTILWNLTMQNRCRVAKAVDEKLSYLPLDAVQNVHAYLGDDLDEDSCVEHMGEEIVLWSMGLEF